MSISWSVHLRRDAASVPLARRLLMRTMETAGVDPEVCYEVSVALSEACANAVEHGGAPHPGGASGAYRVTAYLDGEKCRIEVTDSGPGFPVGPRPGPYAAPARAGEASPAAAAGPTGPVAGGSPAPATGPVRVGDAVPEDARPGAVPGAVEDEAEHGRGLRIIRELADHVHFANRPGPGGAVVSFDKNLKWCEGAPLAMA
ncbi:ATP-binding protein [Streptomyces sp. JNUCC 64]